MAANHKEVVAGAEFAMAQHLRPKGMELALQIRGGFNALAGISRKIRSWQSLAIQLAVRGQRQSLQLHKRCGHHELRQALGEEATQLLSDRPHHRANALDGSRRAWAQRHPIGDQPRVGGIVAPQHRRRLRHGRVIQQMGFNLAGFDPEAAQLDLLIDPPQVGQRPVRVPVRQIAGCVEPFSRVFT